MAMLNPCHPGEILRDNIEAANLSVTEAASRLGCTGQALSRLLNGKASDGPGAGATRLEQCEFLDAAAGDLRHGAGTASTGGLKRETRSTATTVSHRLATVTERLRVPCRELRVRVGCR